MKQAGFLNSLFHRNQADENNIARKEEAKFRDCVARIEGNDITIIFPNGLQKKYVGEINVAAIKEMAARQDILLIELS